MFVFITVTSVTYNILLKLYYIILCYIDSTRIHRHLSPQPLQDNEVTGYRGYKVCVKTNLVYWKKLKNLTPHNIIGRSKIRKNLPPYSNRIGILIL